MHVHRNEENRNLWVPGWHFNATLQFPVWCVTIFNARSPSFTFEICNSVVVAFCDTPPPSPRVSHSPSLPLGKCGIETEFRLLSFLNWKMIADTTDCMSENNLKEITQPDRSGDEAYKMSGNFWFGHFSAIHVLPLQQKRKFKKKKNWSKQNSQRETTNKCIYKLMRA